MDSRIIIWFKKAKCAGSSFESLLQRHGAIYYVDQFTTRQEMENPEIRVICVRGGMLPGGGGVFRTPEGDYRRRPRSRVRRFFGKPYEPRDILREKYPDLFARCHKFAIVRNPYDKFVSSWKYLKSTRDLDALEVLENLPSKRSYHDWLHLTKKQVEYLYDGDTCLVDEVVYMERDFQRSLDALLTSVGLPPGDLPRRNVTKKDYYVHYLDDSVTALVYDAYRDDFETFGYSRDATMAAPVSDWNLDGERARVGGGGPAQFIV